MPTITPKFDAIIVSGSRARATWAELDYAQGSDISTSLDASIVAPVPVGNISTSLDAYLTPKGSLVVGLDASLAPIESIRTNFSAYISAVPAGGRTTRSSLATALTQDVIQPFFAMDLDFDSGSLYFWTGVGDLILNGKTYLGTGNILQISEVEETAEIAARGATLTLSGVPSSILSLALNEPYQGRRCKIYFGVQGDLTQYTEIFSGYMDQMNIVESGQTSTIELTVENKLVDLERPRVSRFTSGYQKSIYPGDRGLDFVEDLQDKNIVWGRKIKEND
jgi:hypothetical protein